MTLTAIFVGVLALGYGIHLVLNAIDELKKQQAHTHKTLLEELEKRR